MATGSGSQRHVTGFGVSRKEILRPHSYKVKGSFGYVDPGYILTRIYTTKSDVFSFGVLLFELIAGRTPKAGLLEYVELAVINTEVNSGWEELVDSRLEDEYYIPELNGLAALAYRCIDSSPINRPSMKDIVQELRFETFQIIVLCWRKFPSVNMHKISKIQWLRMEGRKLMTQAQFF